MKVTLPVASVLTNFSPTRYMPSTSGSALKGLEKNWTLKVVLGVLSSVPSMVVVLPRRTN